jgi:FK506-binding protein 2
MKPTLLFSVLLWKVVLGLVPQILSHSSGLETNECNRNIRRDLICTIPLVIWGTIVAAPLSAGASLVQPQRRGVTTVILDSADAKLGVKLEDITLTLTMTKYPVVQEVIPDSAASVEGIRPGMVILGQTSSASLVQRLQRGPYPYAVQFYDLSVEYEAATTPASALEQARQEADRQINVKEPRLSPRGTGLGVKTTRRVKKSDCTLEARNGDSVTIIYEARVASPGGPIYDSTASQQGQPVTFRLGDGKVISGVDIGIGGMCQGEIRELDIPSGLGYGRLGSEIFDLPGDVRLWWKVELIELVEGEKKFPFRS